MKTLLFLNEASCVTLVWSLLRRERPHVVLAPCLAPASGRILEAITRRLRERDLVRDGHELDPSLADYGHSRAPVYADDTFSRLEPWMSATYGFADAESRLGDDAMPYRHACCNQIRDYLEPLFYLRQARRLAGDALRVRGADRWLSSMADALDTGKVAAPSPSLGAWVVNMAISAAFAVRLAGGVLRSGGFAPTPSDRFDLGSDFLDSPHDETILAEAARAGQSVIVVYRNAGQKANARRPVTAHPTVISGDGRIGFPAAVGDGLDILRRLGRLSGRAGRLPPALFLRAAAVIRKRFDIRKLCRIYRFRNFWCRDDYNSEHIVRSQELRRIGGRSFGISHALPSLANVVPMWRYIDFDVYYTISSDLNRHYKDTWAAGMSVRTVGCLPLTRDRARRIGAERPKDIIFAAKPGHKVAGVVAALRAIAQAFADRTVYLRIKSSHLDAPSTRLLVDETLRDFPNVRIGEGDFWDLMDKASYVVTDPSTVVAEAIQYGLCGFVLDYDDREVTPYRRYPGLCFRTGEEIAKQIADIEAGAVNYRREDYAGLVDISGRTIYEALRDDFSAPTPDRSAETVTRRDRVAQKIT